MRRSFGRPAPSEDTRGEQATEWSERWLRRATAAPLAVTTIISLLFVVQASRQGAAAGEAHVPSGEAAVPSNVPSATATGPVTAGKGINLPGTTTFNLSRVGYEQHEYFLSGTATSYTSASPLAPDGRWTVAPESTAPYKTRMVVYRPIDPSRFDGTVVVEWLNVTGGVDAAAMWLTDHVQLIRSGMVYVGVSAQAAGVVGSSSSLASSTGMGGGIKGADPVRYGSLEHPGDSYSYSMYQQAGASIWRDAPTVLGGLEPKRVIAAGESQSAFRLVTYIDALGPQSSGIYDGYLLYSRGGSGADLSQSPQPGIMPPTPTLIRTDLHVPVLIFETESDVLTLGYLSARQSPTKLIREWEVAGTAHYDTYGLVESMTDTGNGAGDVRTFDTMQHPINSAAGGVITCPLPLNAGAHTYELRAAVVGLSNWVATHKAPPQSPRLEIANSSSYVTNQNGEAVGGIRTPQVQAPVAVVSGLGQPNTGAGGGFCFIFGTTTPFSASKLAQLYPTRAAFVRSWDRAVQADVSAGYLLPADATVLKRVASQSSIGG